LYNNYGQGFVEYRRPGVGRDFHIHFSQEEGAHFTPDSLTLRRAISMRGEKIGSIAIVSDLTELQAKMRQYMEISALALLLSVLATVLLSSRLLRLITEPILQLAEVAGKVSSEQNYSLRAILQSNDEVGKLVRSFNGMLERIKERDTKLKEAKDELEMRVEARTKELQLEVDQRKQTEERLQVSLKELEDFKFALDQHCNVSRTDPEGIITFVNERFCAVSKFEPEEMIGKTHRIVNSGHHSKEFFTELWGTLKSGRSWRRNTKQG
jgi:PAS domain-containing protein